MTKVTMTSRENMVRFTTKLSARLIAAERTRINDLFRSGKLRDEARRRIERELDLREAHLSNQQSQV
jgi:hypothetical protein